MEAFLLSLATVAVAEIGDRTQLLTLMLAAKYRRPWQVLAGVLCATLANHALAGLIGVRVGGLLTPRVLHGVVGASLLGMALWSLKSEAPLQTARQDRGGAFVATSVAFFIAEIGDKTQLATAALAAAYAQLLPVVAGTTAGVLIANAPVVFLGAAFAERLPAKAMHYLASGLFLVLGVVFIVRAVHFDGTH